MTRKQVQAQMKKLGWTTYRLWIKSGVHTSSLYRWLDGTQKSLSVENMEKIRKALKEKK